MTDARRGLFPAIEPFATHRLEVSDLHEIYVAEYGNPLGKPAVVIHGGPGAGMNPMMPRFHDPAIYHMVLFDQRGCGRSTPYAELRENTTWDLVADMERIRAHLGIARWQVFGGSWGSTLALAYAETHPERVSELILRGIFTLQRKELLWFYQEGASHLQPEAFEAYLAPIPEAERGDLIAAYHRRVTGNDPEVQLAAAQAWSKWEGNAISLLPDPARVAAFGEAQYALAFAHDSTWPLRPVYADLYGVGLAQTMARRGVQACGGFRARHDRARDRPRTGHGDGGVQVATGLTGQARPCFRTRTRSRMRASACFTRFGACPVGGAAFSAGVRAAAQEASGSQRQIPSCCRQWETAPVAVSSRTKPSGLGLSA